LSVQRFLARKGLDKEHVHMNIYEHDAPEICIHR
jgi:hypothetical protein